MSVPLPPLITTDIARQSTQEQVLAILNDLSRKVDVLMTEDAAIAAAAARLEADAATEQTTLNALQGIVTALQAQVAAGQPVSPATNAALNTALAHLDTATAAGTAQVTADTPPSGA